MSKATTLVPAELQSAEPYPKLKKVSEVAPQLSLSRSMVYQLMDRGEISYVRIGRSRRIPESAVREFVDRNLVGRKQ